MLAWNPVTAPSSQLRKRSGPLWLPSGGGRAASFRCRSAPEDDKAKAKAPRRPKQQVINVSGGMHIHVDLGRVTGQWAVKSVKPAAAPGAAAPPEQLVAASEWLSNAQNWDNLVRAATVQMRAKEQARLQQQQQQQQQQRLGQSQAVEPEQCSPAATGQLLHSWGQEGESNTGDAAGQGLWPQADAGRARSAAALPGANAAMAQERAAQGRAHLQAEGTDLRPQQAAAAAAAGGAGAGDWEGRKQAARPAAQYGGIWEEDSQVLWRERYEKHIKPKLYFQTRATDTIRQLGSKTPEGPRYWLLENCKVHGVCYLGAERNNMEMTRRLMTWAENPKR